MASNAPSSRRGGEGVKYTIGQRITALALHEIAGFSWKDAAAAANMTSPQALQRLRKKAQSRGFGSIDKIPQVEHVQDAPRSGRPPVVTEEKETQILGIGKSILVFPYKFVLISQVRSDRNSREKSAARIGFEAGVSQSSVHRVFKRNRLSPCKRTIKPGLTPAIRAARLKWCYDHRHWTLEDWKNVIWSDETSVQLGQRRGKIRVWRTPEEAFHQDCKGSKWKGFSDMMFWGCFTYERKGPMHIWEPETSAQKKTAARELKQLNDILEPIKRQEWEITTGIRRIHLTRNLGGKKPEWQWNEKNGKIVRNASKGGIDWYRYQQEILKPKLLPFAQDCQSERPGTIVQEDNAPAHAHHLQEKVFEDFNMAKLVWCGNSPDLNAIEPCWAYMKRTTTARGAPITKKGLKKVWTQCWKHLPQAKIQAWIERLPRHIEQIIEMEGGNDYREGRFGGRSNRPYDPEGRKASYKQASSGLRPGSSGTGKRPDYRAIAGFNSTAD